MSSESTFKIIGPALLKADSPAAFNDTLGTSKINCEFEQTHNNNFVQDGRPVYNINPAQQHRTNCHYLH